MSAIVESRPIPAWASPATFWVLFGLSLGALIVAFLPGLQALSDTWSTVEEYSYGWFIAPLVVFLVWQRSERLRENELPGSWSGLALIALAALMCIAGRLSLVRLLLQYGFVFGIWGLSLCAIGQRGVREIGIPLAMLLLMIPLPHFVLVGVSEQLQLLSSQIGVSLIRACDISVYLEGNVIDLGSMKLQVVEACSGLRYLFPLMALGFVAAYFFQTSLWKRVLLVLSTIPLTILINSLRLGLIGVTVEFWGPTMAEGLLHEFEGWFMFMICLALMILEMSILARVGASGATLRQTFGLELPRRLSAESSVQRRESSRPLQFATAAVVALGLTTLLVPMRVEVVPAREQFASFPLDLDSQWTGRPGRLDRDTLATLQLDDYLYVDYVDTAGHPMNYYIAYYATQTGAEKASHSPKTCIPGGGWTITQSKEVIVPLANGKILPANRVLIERGEQHELVYYWFKQGARNVAGDWLVKWYIVLDSIARGRTDGALVRVVAPVPRTTSIEDVDQRIAGFIRTTDPLISTYIPD